jgi:hypothetical protein
LVIVGDVNVRLAGKSEETGGRNTRFPLEPLGLIANKLADCEPILVTAVPDGNVVVLLDEKVVNAPVERVVAPIGALSIVPPVITGDVNASPDGKSALTGALNIAAPLEPLGVISKRFAAPDGVPPPVALIV